MDIIHGIGEMLQAAGIFGGIALVILAGNKAKLDRMRAERQLMREAAAPQSDVSAELRALQQQVAEMQDTGHQFDLSFDAALSRLEERVSRVETKVAAAPAASPEETQRVGLR